MLGGLNGWYKTIASNSTLLAYTLWLRFVSSVDTGVRQNSS